ncbi:sensor histidine kinase [Clostridium fallax]|uniref:Two-component system, sensor histidine kinase YesM n=1 Tax=Clostridium fallax TaxID=1533 RepID=A0A1M4VUC2_9CLOT|nr:histidine kinase [Clostridium fallax]SHE72517.1 two-component system, sensor histidine kinase YesM [Clostridium fallax]SQB07696.1 sensor histidine kinase [Clostridium fallax]
MKFINYKNNMYKRLFITYSIIIIFTLSIIDIYTTKKVIDTTINEQLYLNRKIIEDTNTYLNNQKDYTKTMINQLYQSTTELNDILYYLNNDLNKYLINKLDIFSMSNKNFYKGMSSYIKSSFDMNSTLSKISLYSYKNKTLTIFNKKGEMHEVDIKSKKDINDNIQNTNNKFGEVLEYFNKEHSNSDSLCYTISKEIKDPHIFENVGMLIFTFDLSPLDKIVEKYEKSNSELIVLSSSGEVYYDSQRRFIRETYPYIDELHKNKESAYLGQKCYLDYSPNGSGMILISAVPERTVIKKTELIVISIQLLVIVLSIVGESLIYMKLRKLEKRTSNVLKAMNKVKDGNLQARIPIDECKDEIGIISENFNCMCEQLDSHIKSMYVAKLNEKKAEIRALQSQINPHFLYNTLESIRMRAICNGDKETGKMLYNLATLFRNVVKGSSIVTVKSELDYCRMYLDLFKFRYEDRFEYDIDCEVDILEKQIIKLSLQPLIENFIVHGIDLSRKDNFLLISVREVENIIIIELEDNGKGIDDDKLKELQERIEKCDNNGKSIGVINVHERILLTYGKGYGITVEKGDSNGTKITMRIPKREVDNNV